MKCLTVCIAFFLLNIPLFSNLSDFFFLSSWFFFPIITFFSLPPDYRGGSRKAVIRGSPASLPPCPAPEGRRGAYGGAWGGRADVWPTFGRIFSYMYFMYTYKRKRQLNDSRKQSTLWSKEKCWAQCLNLCKRIFGLVTGGSARVRRWYNTFY